MTSTLEQDLTTKLQQQQAQQLERVRQAIASPQGVMVKQMGQEILSFNSNDYLGLANHPCLIKALQQGARDYGVGSGASALLGGYSVAHQRLEETAAEFLQRDRALVFSSGQLANMAVLSSLVARQDTVLHDHHNHASLLDATLLSRAKLMRYRHLDYEDLKRRLPQRPATKKWIVTESVFSMSGDVTPLTPLVALAQQYQATLMVDEAHGMGCLGPQGRGSVIQQGLNQTQVPVLMATLGKACGVAGAVVAGSEPIIESLIQRARPYIYTTALPPALAVAATASLHLVAAAEERRAQLQQNIHTFKQGASQLNLPLISSNTAIQPVLLYDNDKALRVERVLQQQGLWVRAIRPPTVAVGTARLRVSLNAQHTKIHLNRLLEALAQCLQ